MCGGRRYLDGAHDGVRLADNSDYYRAELDGFGGIFDLEYSALRRAGNLGVSFRVARTGNKGPGWFKRTM